MPAPWREKGQGREYQQANRGNISEERNNTGEGKEEILFEIRLANFLSQMYGDPVK